MSKAPAQPLSYQQLQKHRYILLMLVLALVVIVVGIFVELLGSRKVSQVDPQLKILAKPLDPTFRYEVFDKLRDYTYLSPEQVHSEIERLPIRILDKESDTIKLLDKLQTGEGIASNSVQPATATGSATVENTGTGAVSSATSATSSATLPEGTGDTGTSTVTQ